MIHDFYARTNNLNIRKTSMNKWSTMAGLFSMSYESEVKIKLPYLNNMAHSFAQFHVTRQKVFTT